MISAVRIKFPSGSRPAESLKKEKLSHMYVDIEKGEINMRNTLTDLNNYLFETLERLTDDEMKEEQMQKEITRSQAVTSVASTIIQNGELALKTMKHLNEIGIETTEGSIPPMLEVKK